MSYPKTPPTPAKIYELSCAYWNTRLLISAGEIGVFALLGRGPATEEEIRQGLDLNAFALRDFLDALVVQGLLVKEGDQYRNGVEAETYLVPGTRHYMGGYLDFVSKFMWPSWEGLTDLLRHGKPQFPHAAVDGETPEVAEGEFYEYGYADQETQRIILEGADALNVGVAYELTKHIDWRSFGTLVDLGGARGNVAGIILGANPQLRATVFDLAPQRPFFDEHMARLGLTDRTSFQPGDWFADPLPEGDVLLCGHALHNWSTEQRRTVIDKAYQAVRPGGAFMIYDLMIDEDRRLLFPLLLSLLMRLGMGGSGYSAEECRGLMRDAGFVDITSVRLDDYDRQTVVIGRKAH